MPEIRAFKGIRYNPTKVTMADVVAPPYDVISPQRQEELYAASPYNIVRLDFGREEDRYTSAARLFSAWMAEGVFVKEERPAMYLLVQDFVTPEGKQHQRKGFIALCRLEEFDNGSILPHEKTLAKPKEDRLRLLQETHAHFSQIFCVYDDPQRQVEKLLRKHLQKSEPVTDVTFEDVRNRIWKITIEEELQSIQQLIGSKKVFVADGHHRYETALEFRNTMMKNNPAHTGEELYNFIAMYFTNLHDKGLVILPTHRVLHSVPSFDSKSLLQHLSLYFLVDRYSGLDELVAVLKRKKQFAFGLILPSEPRYHLLSLMSESHLKSLIPAKIPSVLRKLDVTILHAVVFEKILNIPTEAQKQKQFLEYVKSISDADEAVTNGGAQAAFLMNPTSIEQVRTVAEAGQTMPQKSTYFYPKLLSGLIISSLDD